MLSGLFGSKASSVVNIVNTKDAKIDKIGEKGSAISRILRCGLAVPQGFVITTDVSKSYSTKDQCVLSNEVKKDIDDSIHNLAIGKYHKVA